MSSTKRAIKNAAKSTPMIFGHIPQDVIDAHYHGILDVLKSKNPEQIAFHLACINYLKDLDGYGHIRFAAQNAVMHGWLSVDAKNNFIVKEGLV